MRVSESSSALAKAVSFLADGLSFQPVEDDPNREEWERCKADPQYFISTYCKIQDSVSRDWIPFELWPAQHEAVDIMHNHQLVAWIKSRQIGASWLAVAYALYDGIFQAIATVLIFSKRETEAKYLLSDQRLRGMFHRLPEWMKPTVIRNDANLFSLSNGSTFYAFPTGTGAGDSYTATLAIADEADLAPDLDIMVTSIKPTIDAGGKLFLIGRANKREPNSAFKQLYKKAKLGQNDYYPLFVPWYAHPDRDERWYEQQKKDLLTLDDLWEQYPATDDQALALGYVGRIYPLFDKENISELADYDPSVPSVLWMVDDGFTAPRVILFAQERYFDGRPDVICIFDEIVHTQRLASESIQEGLDKSYHRPEWVYHDPAAAEFGGVARSFDLPTWGGWNNVHEGIKVVRRFICTGNGYRRIMVHPRCTHLIDALANYHTKEESNDGNDPKPVHDDSSHPADALRYGVATRHIND